MWHANGHSEPSAKKFFWFFLFTKRTACLPLASPTRRAINIIQHRQHLPRFGLNKILTAQQISDVVAFLFDPASPVNADTK